MSKQAANSLEIPNSPDRARLRATRISKPISRWAACLLIAVGSFSIIFASGCRIRNLNVNEAILVSYRDMVWARRAYNLNYGNCERPYGEHFYNGFCQGYTDICNGGDGYVPALPPSAYRNPKFQSADGVQCVNAWFEGYPAGVAAAKKEKVGNYNNVLVSKMIDTAVTTEKNSKRVLPSDVPVTNGRTNAASESMQEIAAPPVPDLTSSVLIPSHLEMAGQPAMYQRNQPYMAGPATNFPPGMANQMPPMVTGSGIAQEAKNNLDTPQSNPSQSTRRLR